METRSPGAAMRYPDHMIPGRTQRACLLASILVAVGAASCTTDGDVPCPAPLPDATPPDSGAQPLDQRDPVAPSALLLDFKGLVNTPENASETTHATYGKATFLAIADGQTTWMTDDPIAYIYRYPDDYPVEEKRGQEFLVLQAYREQSVSGAEVHADMAQVYVPREALAALAGRGDGAIHPADGLRANLRRYSGYYRSDHVTFVRDCYRGFSDDDLPASELVVDARSNESFSPGETVLATANIGLRTDYVSLSAALEDSLEAHEGMFCSCTRNGQRIPCADWQNQIHEDPASLSCELPQDFLDSPGPSRSVFRFKGKINSTGGTMENGTGLFDVALDDQPVGLEYSSYAYRSKVASGSFAGKDMVSITSLGGVQLQTQTRYTYNALIANFLVDGLMAAKTSGQNGFSLDVQHIFGVNVYAVEQIDNPGDTWQKICPRAVNEETNASVWLCHGANESFAVGEQLEIAGNVVLTQDPEKTGASGAGAGCSCTHDNVAVDCNDFPAPGDGG